MHKFIRMLLKCHFSSFSYFFLIDSIAYQLKQLLRYFSHRTTLLRYSTPFSALLSANWKEQRFWLSTVLQCSNSTPFEATLHTCSSHKTHVLFFAYDSCLQMLTESLSIWHLVTHDHLDKNFYLTFFVQIYCDWSCDFFS